MGCIYIAIGAVALLSLVAATLKVFRMYIDFLDYEREN